MDRLRKTMTLIAVIAVFFVLRVAWAESSKLRPNNGSLMRSGVYLASYSRNSRLGSERNLASDAYDNSNEEALETKADVKDNKLDDSLDLLRNSSSGKQIAETLDNNRVKISFGKPKTAGAAAVFVPNFLGNGGSIIVSERLRDQEPYAIAAILAHEGTHARNGSILDYDSVEQEYKSYVAQAKVWKELRPAMTIAAGGIEAEIAEPNAENDYALDILEMGKKKAYGQIWKDYKQIGIDLPVR